MKKIISLWLMAAAVITANAQDKLYSDEFPLGDVQLLDGPLKKARDSTSAHCCSTTATACWRLIARRQD